MFFRISWGIRIKLKNFGINYDTGNSASFDYDSTNKFRVGATFFTGKPTVATLDLDSDKILILDATDNQIKQSNISTLATAAAGVGNTAKLLALIGL